MPLKSFIIPVFHAEWAEQELNRFLQTHRVLNVKQRFVEQGSDSFWAVLVDFLAASPSTASGSSSAGRSTAPGSVSKKRVDYKERLSEADFEVYLQLRAFRKEIAAEEGLALYAVFTNEQLAQVAEQRLLSKVDLLKIPGIGQARADKYGPRLFSFLQQIAGARDETGGKAAGADR